MKYEVGQIKHDILTYFNYPVYVTQVMSRRHIVASAYPHNFSLRCFLVIYALLEDMITGVVPYALFGTKIYSNENATLTLR